MKQHVALAAVANVTNTNVYAVRVRIDVHVIINGFPVDPVIRAIRVFHPPLGFYSMAFLFRVDPSASLSNLYVHVPFFDDCIFLCVMRRLYLPIIFCTTSV